MLSLILCALFAVATAAPYYGEPRFHDHGFGHYHAQPYFRDNLFDTQKFWMDLSREMRELDEMLSQMAVRFPSRVCTQGYEDNQYKITITLSGFEEKDIIVKAREGLLMVQATHSYGPNSINNYVDFRTLPDNVNVTGSWLFENEVLKIVFPLKDGAELPVSTTETVTQDTESPSQSREEVGNEIDDENQDADVGLNRGDLANQDTPLSTEAPRLTAVEATTYAVDLKDEVEFVPVRY